MACIFFYGMCGLFMNWAGGHRAEKELFIYISMLMPLINLEEDAVALIAGAIQIGVLAVLTAYVIYGRSVSSVHIEKYPS